MTMRFVDRPRKRQGISHAARYLQDSPLDELQEVARRVDDDAELAEVPELGVLVVRYLHQEFLVVPNGRLLVYSETHDLLYKTDEEKFRRDHEPWDQAHTQ